jgi:hypothetical protein
MLQDTTWGEESARQEMAASNDVVRGTASVEPEVDVDAWFAQREQMIDRLQARRETLLEEVIATERKLRILGIEVVPTEDLPSTPPRAAAPKSRRRVKARVAKSSDLDGLGAKSAHVIRAMTKTPEKVSDIGKRVGLGYSTVWRALETARARGLVKSTGTKGKDVMWALV